MNLLNLFDKDDARRQLISACTLIRHWHGEGKKLPGYVRGNGSSYLMLLLGVEHRGAQHCADYLYEKHPGLVEALCSPHGWAVMRTLIIRGRANINKAAHEQLKIKARNKKRRDWRFLQKEG